MFTFPLIIDSTVKPLFKELSVRKLSSFSRVLKFLLCKQKQDPKNNKVTETVKLVQSRKQTM